MTDSRKLLLHDNTEAEPPTQKRPLGPPMPSPLPGGLKELQFATPRDCNEGIYLYDIFMADEQLHDSEDVASEQPRKRMATGPTGLASPIPFRESEAEHSDQSKPRPTSALGPYSSDAGNGQHPFNIPPVSGERARILSWSHHTSISTFLDLVDDPPPIYWTETQLLQLRGSSRRDQTSKPSLPKRIYSKSANFKRKALRILFDGNDTFARPDSASDQDVMTEAFAISRNISIQRSEANQNLFMLDNGKYIKSVGKAQVPIKLLGNEESEEYRWFHVLRSCPVPLILGMAFIEKIRLYTKNKHLLVDCPHNFGNMPTLKWIGSPRGFINFRADGKQLVGCADSGSDLDFMSLSCAKRLGFKIDRNLKTRVKLADGSVVETVGQVHTSSIELSGFDSFEMSFDILPGLASDAIFSEEFLDQMDAFNTCAQVGNTQDPYQQRLNTLISLGPIQRFLVNFFSKKRKSKALDTTEQRHTDSIEAEIYRRSEANRVIKKMKDDERASAARERERSMCEAFDRGHERCTHCLPRLRGHLPIIPPNGSFTPGLENPSLML